MVRWLDAAFSLDDAEVEPIVVETFGLIEDVGLFFRVHGERVGEDTTRAVTAIPKEIVLDVRDVA
jgi:hypothetical protein